MPFSMLASRSCDCIKNTPQIDASVCAVLTHHTTDRNRKDATKETVLELPYLRNAQMNLRRLRCIDASVGRLGGSSVCAHSPSLTTLAANDEPAVHDVDCDLVRAQSRELEYGCDERTVSVIQYLHPVSPVRKCQ